MTQRYVDRVPWVYFGFVTDAGVAYRVNKDLRYKCTVAEVNAACNATIIISKMVRNGRKAWTNRHMR